MTMSIYSVITLDGIFDKIIENLSYLETLSLVRAIPRLRSRCPSFVQLLRYHLQQAHVPDDFSGQINKQAILSGSFLLYLLLSTPITVLNKSSSGPGWSYGDIDIFYRNNKIDKYLTKYANKNPNNANPDSCSVDLRKWAFGNVIINDVALDKDTDMKEFITEMDLDICKNYYDGKTLVITHPLAILKQKCTFVVQDLESAAPIDCEEKLDILRGISITVENKVPKYQNRGFEIDVRLLSNCKLWSKQTKTLYQKYGLGSSIEKQLKND